MRGMAEGGGGGGPGAGPRSMLMGGGKLGSVGRASLRSAAGSMATGDRMAGRPPGGMCGLVRWLLWPHCSGSAAGAARGA